MMLDMSTETLVSFQTCSKTPSIDDGEDSGATSELSQLQEIEMILIELFDVVEPCVAIVDAEKCVKSTTTTFSPKTTSHFIPILPSPQTSPPTKVHSERMGKRRPRGMKYRRGSTKPAKKARANRPPTKTNGKNEKSMSNDAPSPAQKPTNKEIGDDLSSTSDDVLLLEAIDDSAEGWTWLDEYPDLQSDFLEADSLFR